MDGLCLSSVENGPGWPVCVPQNDQPVPVATITIPTGNILSAVQINRMTPSHKTFTSQKLICLDIQVRVGPNYQADIPELHTEKYTERHKSLSVWVPSDNFTEDDKLIDYFFLSKTKYGYNTEQSLGLLFHNNFNLSKAFKDLPNYTRIINWSNFEKHNFEIAFLKFGKNFEQIRKQIPNKPLKEIIGYYYLQKHKENALYTIMVEDSINKLKPWCKRHQKVNCGTSNLAKLNNEDSDDMIIKKYCSFCGVLCMDYHQTLSPICEQCYSYIRKMQESGDRLILCLPCPDKFHWMLAHKKCLSPQDMYNYQHILKFIGQGETNDEEIHTAVRTRSSYKKKKEKKNKFYKYAKCYESISTITNNCIFPQCNSAGILCPIPDITSSKVKLPFMRLN